MVSNKGGAKTYTRVSHTQATAYYRWNKGTSPMAKAFPPKFRMITASTDAGADQGGPTGGTNTICISFNILSRQCCVYFVCFACFDYCYRTNNIVYWKYSLDSLLCIVIVRILYVFRLVSNHTNAAFTSFTLFALIIVIRKLIHRVLQSEARWTRLPVIRCRKKTT